MDLTRLFESCASLKLYEKRSLTPEEIEVVFFTQDAEAWNKKLEQGLGPALKPAGAKPSTEARQVAEPFGGVRPDQTLYRKSLPDETVVGMCWPWQDKQHITLKIFKTGPLPAAEPAPEAKKKKLWFF